jgi:hypothetical protein
MNGGSIITTISKTVRLGYLWPGLVTRKSLRNSGPTSSHKSILLVCLLPFILFDLYSIAPLKGNLVLVVVMVFMVPAVF